MVKVVTHIATMRQCKTLVLSKHSQALLVSKMLRPSSGQCYVESRLCMKRVARAAKEVVAAITAAMTLQEVIKDLRKRSRSFVCRSRGITLVSLPTMPPVYRSYAATSSEFAKLLKRHGLSQHAAVYAWLAELHECC